MNVRALVSLGLFVAGVSVAACGDEAISAAKDTFEVLDVFVPVDVAADVLDTVAPRDTAVADSALADTALDAVADAGADADGLADAEVALDVADTSVAPDTVLTEDTAVADTSVADTTVAGTSVAADTTPADTTPADVGPQACPPPADETLVATSTVWTGQDYTGAKNAVTFASDLCSDAPDSAERTYRFELTEPTEVYAETSCDFDCELVVTKGGCDDANVIDCETSIGDEIYAGTLAAGSYRMFIEGDNPGDPDGYDFMLNFNRTGGQASCVASNIDVTNSANCQDPTFGSPRYEFLLANQATELSDGDDFFIQDVGACTNDAAHVGGAPDKVYAFTLGAEREVEITVDPDGWDAMVAVSAAPCGARSALVTCADSTVFGGTDSLTATLPAGTWYIIVDGFGEETFSGTSHGPFSLEVLVFDEACNQ